MRKRTSKPERAPAVTVQRVVSRLYKQYRAADAKNIRARKRAATAQAAYEDTVRDCQKAWNEYNTARRQMPANND